MRAEVSRAAQSSVKYRNARTTTVATVDRPARNYFSRLTTTRTIILITVGPYMAESASSRQSNYAPITIPMLVRACVRASARLYSY